MPGQEGDDALAAESSEKPEETASTSDDTGAESSLDSNASAVDPDTEEQATDEEPTIESLTAALVVAQAEADEAKDRALRAVAEAENVRRRADRSVENAHKFALERFASDLLPAIDSFDRAAATVRDLATNDASVVATAEGIELSLKVLNDVLGKHGVQAIEPEGEPFDPQYHEAMSMIENPDAEPGSVLHVVEKGYTLNDRLVRAARVIVAKAPASNDASSPDE